MYNLGLVLITANRPMLVQEYISNIIDSLKNYNIALYIIDGSKDDSTKKVASEFDSPNIFYLCQPTLSFTQRVFYGLHCCNAKYACVTGDAKLLLVNCLNYLFSLMEKQYDIIILSYRDNKRIIKKEYYDIVDYFRDNCWDATLFGTVFIKKYAFREMVIEEYPEKFKDNLFPQILYYFNGYLEKNNFLGYYEGTPIITISKNTISSWNDILSVFGRQWVECIALLDKKYDPYKNDVILDHGIYSSLEFGRNFGFHRLRANGKIDQEIFEKYKDILPIITNVNIQKIKKISNEPKFIAKFAVLWYKAIRRIKRTVLLKLKNKNANSQLN